MKIPRIGILGILLTTLLLHQPATAGDIMGTVVAINPEYNEIVVKTEVEGLMGPIEKVIAYRLNPDTRFTVCLEIADECYRSVSAREGWNILESFENVTSLAVLDKEVRLKRTGDNRIKHVEITYRMGG